MPTNNQDTLTTFAAQLWADQLAQQFTTYAPIIEGVDAANNFYGVAVEANGPTETVTWVNDLTGEELNVPITPKKAKEAPAPFRKTDSLQILIGRLEGLEASINQELAELDNVRSQLEIQGEVLEEIGSRVRNHISNLRKDAIQLGRKKSPGLQSYQYQPGQELFAGQTIPEQAPQIAEAATEQAAPAPFAPDQG